MAKKHTNEVAVGLTALVALVLAVYVVVALGDWQNLFADKQRIKVQVPYKVGLKGLAQGSPVLLGGAKIGQICETSIGKDKADPDTIWVYFTIEIPKEYTLRDDCVLAPISNVLGGQSSLAIKDVGKGNKLTDDDVLILPDRGENLEKDEGEVRVTFEPTITDAINNLKDQLNADNKDSLMRQIKDLVAKIDGQVSLDEEGKSFLSKMHGIMDKLNTITAELKSELDAENKKAVVAKMHEVLAKLDRSLAEVEDLVKSNKDDISASVSSAKNTLARIEQDTPEILDKIKKVLNDLEPAVARAEALVTEIKDTVAVNRPMIDELLVKLNEIATNLKLASSDIRRAPWKLLYQPGKSEAELQKLVDSAGAFATGAEQLESTSLRLQALLAEAGDRTPDDVERIQTILAELETSFKRFRLAEDKFWKEIK